MTTGNAEQLGELLSAYVDGELDERDSQRAASILRQDPHARQLYADLKRTRELIQGLPRHVAPASIATDVLARLERSALLPEGEARPPVRKRSRVWWRAPLSLAAVLGLCALGWWTLSFEPREDHDRLSRVDAPVGESMERTISLKPASDADTVEGKLASGIALASLQQHHFANEPVRLQLVVDSERERDEIVRRVSERLAAAKVSDLAGDRAKEEAAGARAVDATFFYQGRPGVNFPDRTSQQLLVRAQPRQVETVLKEVDRVARRDDQLALQAGPLSMQGRRGIDALQLFADAASPAPGRDAARERVISAPAVAEADGSKQDEEAARFVRELLKTAGIDPSKVASGGPAGSAERPRRARAGGDVRSQPASTTEEESAAVADVGSAVSAPAAAGAKQESHLTFVLEVLAKPKSSTPTGGGNLRRSGTSRNSSRSEAGQPGLHLPS